MRIDTHSHIPHSHIQLSISIGRGRSSAAIYSPLIGVQKWLTESAAMCSNISLRLKKTKLRRHRYPRIVKTREKATSRI